MNRAVDPMSTAGRWLVTTASGALHLIESTGPDGVVTVTRVTADFEGAEPGYRLATRRRDGDALEVAGVTHLQGGSPVNGILVGRDMYLILEPLDPRAYATVRRTTPVTSIETLDGEGGDS